MTGLRASYNSGSGRSCSTGIDSDMAGVLTGRGAARWQWQSSNSGSGKEQQ